MAPLQGPLPRDRPDGAARHRASLRTRDVPVRPAVWVRLGTRRRIHLLQQPGPRV